MIIFWIVNSVMRFTCCHLLQDASSGSFLFCRMHKLLLILQDAQVAPYLAGSRICSLASVLLLKFAFLR